jgi:hypothetical protein
MLVQCTSSVLAQYSRFVEVGAVVKFVVKNYYNYQKNTSTLSFYLVKVRLNTLLLGVASSSSYYYTLLLLLYE